MFEIFKTSDFNDWLVALRDRRAAARIQARIDRLALGNPGDMKSVSQRVSELRVDYGPGYRVYFTHKGPVIIVLLCGGDKSTQRVDIKKAEALAAAWEAEQ